jgi:hypothetical protein
MNTIDFWITGAIVVEAVIALGLIALAAHMSELGKEIEKVHERMNDDNKFVIAIFNKVSELRREKNLLLEYLGVEFREGKEIRVKNKVK